MKQPMHKFILYWTRRKELKQMREKTIQVIRELEASDFIDNDDKVMFIQRMNKNITYKKNFMFSPIETSPSDIPKIRQEQEVLASYMAKVKNENEMKLLQEVFKSIENFFRLHEMFEQNVIFAMFIITIVFSITTPLLIIFI